MWIVSAIMSFIIYNIIIVVLFRKTEEFKFFAEKVKIIVNKFTKKEVIA